MVSGTRDLIDTIYGTEISNKSKNNYPFLDSLLKNFKSATKKGNGHLDWSAISLENQKL